MNYVTGLWSVSWEAIRKKCDVRGPCGRNAICVYTPEARCACPPGLPRTDFYGFGAVYMGVLADDRVVEVKRLGNIYEYISNLSLDTHLFTSNFIGWKQRYKVALGTAKGLAYLHDECLEWVIHCDTLGWQSLAKLLQRGAPNSEFSRIRGTKGYMAPEWALNLPITAKLDVYSYGVVILELVKGIRLSTWVVDYNEVQEVELTKFVRVMKSRILDLEEPWPEDIIDPRLQGKFNKNQAAVLIEIGLACVEEDRTRRPTMDSVVQTLLKYEDKFITYQSR
ncbi:hypothetical protein DCAR_0311839 [Daucus carota subsp. sativus]|uniref:Protein kinase domain-containing protein n=2 Tax=Daucus carota subsp. sativus TaxID=79200 RepID=A0AAF1AU45_DAUCS|nr:hypothetical protein DCAR_0311839 [Daucus carota subsp. sativus]